MKTLLLLILLTAFPLINVAQTHFENGYFIDNNGNMTEVLIKNMDWKYNPDSFEYKLSENSEINILNLQNTQEVVISEKIKYTRHDVEIDRSATSLTPTSVNRQPEFNIEKVFLKSLVEGNANLLFYRQANSVQFFYSVNKSRVKPLVYKKYQAATNKIGENNAYKQALLNDLQCDEITLRDVERLKYKDNSLVDFFVKYNECTGSEFVNYITRQTKFGFNMAARVGLNFLSLETHTTLSRYDINFGSQSNFQFGIEAELLLPYNNHKWAIIFEPTYQYFKAEKTILLTDRPSSARYNEIDYRSIDLPLGLRHYFFLNDASKFFVNASAVWSLDMNTIILREYSDSLRVTPVESNFAFGIGYSYNRISAEVRYSTSRNLLSNYSHWFTNYDSTSIILGYRFF